MQKITWVFFLGFVVMGYTQEVISFRGAVVVDSLHREAIHIINQTQNLGTVSDPSGYFEIKARIGDTLRFSSVQYRVKQYVVSAKDLASDIVKIALEVAVNELDEVIVSQYSLSGDVEKDLQKIPTYTENLPFWNAAELKRLGVGTFDDAQSDVQNLVLGGNRYQAQVSLDLTLLMRSISRIFKKKKSPVAPIKKTDFFDEKFIVQYLDIPETEFYNFLDHVEAQSYASEILQSEDALKILGFLIAEVQVFKEKYTIKK